MKILYPTDGSKAARAALEFALDIAKSQGCKIIVLSVAENIGILGREWKEMERTLLEFAQEFAEKAVKEISQNGVEAEKRVEVGKPADVIVKTAEKEGVYAIVMGTHGWAEISRPVIGSVADRVIRRSPCPVVLVPTRLDKD